MVGFAILGAKITIDAYHSHTWADGLKIGPITFVGSLNAAVFAAAVFNRGVIEGRSVPNDISRLLPHWWIRTMQAAVVVSVLCLMAGFIGEAFQPKS